MGLISLLKKKKNKTLFTTPSHSNSFFIVNNFYKWYKKDISEVDAYKPTEALKASEEWAANIYGTKYTKYLTNGSTSGIICAVLASLKNKKILIWNNAHPCHKNAAVLANCDINEYSQNFNNEWGIYTPLLPNEVEDLIKIHKPNGIIITSPTYEGLVCDVISVSKICKKNNVILIVDEAHGALYPFSEKLPESAVKYADYTIQSLHKTAGGLNPTALLHSNDKNPDEELNLISTTSPSYPMLATIEANIHYLNSQKGKKNIEKLLAEINELKTKVNTVEFGGDDITKILIKKDGMTGFQLSETLYNKYNIEDERTNEVSTLLLCGLGTTKNKIQKLRKALNGIK